MTVRPAGMGHVGLMVHDLEGFVRWYEEVLGFQVSDRMPFDESYPYYEGVWLRCDENHHVISVFGLRDWYVEHLGIEVSEWGPKPFEWTPGGSTTWAVFDHDTDYFGRPDQAFMVNFRVADLDAMLAQLRSAGVEVIDALEESEYGRFGWAVDPEGTRFELWEPPPGG